MDIFNEPTIETPKFEDLVGEGKKYKTTDDAARAIIEKDKFIQRLLEEKRTVEEDLKTRINMQEFLDRVQTPVSPQPVLQPVTNPQPAPASELTAEQIEKLVQQQIANREAETARSRNLLTVQGRLQETLGENYATQVKQRARDLGLDIQYFNDTAARSPQAFFELMGLNRPREELTTLPRGTSNPPTPSGTVKNFAYFNKMRKENPVEYSRYGMKEEWELAKKLGADFYN
jgi:hypothetical protein